MLQHRVHVRSLSSHLASGVSCTKVFLAKPVFKEAMHTIRPRPKCESEVHEFNVQCGVFMKRL